MNKFRSLWSMLNRSRTYNFETHLQYEWQFYINIIRPGWMVIDAGANIGELTLLFSKFVGEQGQVHAFEPTPETFERLKVVTEAGTRFDNVVLQQFAVSDQIGMLEFHTYGEQYAAWNGFADIKESRSYAKDLPEAEIITVPTTTLDEYCAEHELGHVNLIKLDVEGAEWQALNGAKRLFAEKRVDYCVFEVGPSTISEFDVYPEQLTEFFRKNNYHLKNIAPYSRTFVYDQSHELLEYSVLVASRI